MIFPHTNFSCAAAEKNAMLMMMMKSRAEAMAMALSHAIYKRRFPPPVAAYPMKIFSPNIPLSFSNHFVFSSYMRCVSEHMKELKPFGDVPDKLSLQIKRSFVATRTYGQALTTASEVAKKVLNVS